MKSLTNFYKGKTVLITGHTGFKGSWLLKSLDILGASCYGISDKYYPSNLHSKLIFSNLVQSKILDISNFDELHKLITKIKPDIIFHLAAQPLVIESYTKPYDTYKTNVFGTLNICESISKLKHKVSFICVTTDKVYKNKETHHKYTEIDELNGFDPYSNSKSCADLLTQTYLKTIFKDNVRCSICRSGNVIGGGDSCKNRIVPDIYRSIVRNTTLEIRSPNSIRPYQHVLEADFAYLKIAMMQYQDSKYSSIYNIAPDDESIITTSDLVEKFSLLNKNLIVNYTNNSKFHEANLLLLDNNYIKKMINWKPLLNIEESVKWTNEWASSKNKEEVTKKQINEYINLLGEAHE